MGMGGDLSNFNMNNHGPPSSTMGNNLSGLQSNSNINNNQGFPSNNSNSGFSTNNSFNSVVLNPTSGLGNAIPPEEVEKFEIYFETTDEQKQGWVSG